MAKQAGFGILEYRDLSQQVRRTWDDCAVRLIWRLASDRFYRELLTSTRTRNRSFALSLPRLMFAYRTGAMRYGLFSFVRC